MTKNQMKKKKRKIAVSKQFKKQNVQKKLFSIQFADNEEDGDEEEEETEAKDDDVEMLMDCYKKVEEITHDKQKFHWIRIVIKVTYILIFNTTFGF